MYLEVDAKMTEIYTPQLYFSKGVSSAPNKYRMKKLHPREFNVLTTSIESHKTFDASSLGVRVLLALDQVLRILGHVRPIFGTSTGC
jgi:hypothetical protein